MSQNDGIIKDITFPPDLINVINMSEVRIRSTNKFCRAFVSCADNRELEAVIGLNEFRRIKRGFGIKK